jgi:hypothetical protein
MRIPQTILAVAATAVVCSTASAGAASLITGAQIKNGTVTSADVRDGSLRLHDFAPGTVEQLVGPMGRTGQGGQPGSPGQPGSAGPRGERGPEGPMGPAGVCVVILGGTEAPGDALECEDAVPAH